MVAHLRQAGDRCSLADCQPALSQKQRWMALGHLFEAHSMLEKALNIWQNLGSEHNPMSEPGCDGVASTVELLAQCPDKDMVLKYSGENTPSCANHTAARAPYGDCR